VCLDFLARLEKEPEFFSHVITSDESSILEYDSETKRQNSGVAHCKLSPSQEIENEQIQNQMDSLFFFFCQGIIHKEFLPLEQTVNQTFYQEVIK
jgi:hypothetical protein